MTAHKSDSPHTDGSPARRLPVGAEVVGTDGVHFRVWAPRRKRVRVVLEGNPRPHTVELEAEDGGYFAGLLPGVGDGARYRYRLEGDAHLYPDPASRFQPEGPNGPSQVVDPGRFQWTDGAWRGRELKGQVLYEMHVGTFTPDGTWAAAARELPELAALGVTALSVMPVAEFPGDFGWGYDGVNLFAPTHLYGTPDDFRRFVDAAHGCGLAVLLDVVYSHFGPDGNFTDRFAKAYHTDRYDNEWGGALNFDGDDAGPVRDFFTANAGYWIDEFHLDGLRLDGTQQMFDASPTHILAEIVRRVREAAGKRHTIVVGENEPQHAGLVRPPERGGYGMDALWNDDFHRCATVALTGHNEAYFTDYRGSAQEFVSTAKWGYLYQGQRYVWQEKRRGKPALDLPPAHLVTYLQNHDQLANSGQGLRFHLLTSPGRYRAMTALMLLLPGTPMLFQGQEFAASSPFFYFADHEEEVAEKIREGRAKFLSQFATLAAPGGLAQVPDPADPTTFGRCKLDFSERERNRKAYDLHKDLLRLRRDDPAFSAQRHRGLDGAVLGPDAFVLRYFADDGLDRLLVVNLGRDLRLSPAPEPLLAPPEGAAWEVLWTSEDARYGGCGTPPPDSADGWHVQGEAAVALRPVPAPAEEAIYWPRTEPEAKSPTGQG